MGQISDTTPKTTSRNAFQEMRTLFTKAQDIMKLNI